MISRHIQQVFQIVLLALLSFASRCVVGFDDNFRVFDSLVCVACIVCLILARYEGRLTHLRHDVAVAAECRGVIVGSTPLDGREIVRTRL